MSNQSPEPRGWRARTWLRLALGAAISVGLLALLAREVDLDDVRDVLVGADPAWIALGLALYLLLQVVRALRFKLLAPEAPMRVLLGVQSVQVLLLRVMPMRTGELGFAWLMRRSGAGGFVQSLVGIAVVRILDLASLLAMFAGGLLVWNGRVQGLSHLVMAGAIGAGALAALAPLYLRHLLVLAHRMLDGTLAGIRLTRLPAVQGGQHALASAIDGVKRLPHGVLWQANALSVVQNGINFLLFGVLLEAMGVHVSGAQVVLGGTGSALGGLLPLAGVGNFGPLEAGWSLGFAAVGVPTDAAIATAFGFSVISFGYALVTGAVGWVSLPRPRAAST